MNVLECRICIYRSETGEKNAERMLAQGWLQKVKALDTKLCLFSVPSASGSKSYKVDLARLTCDCVAAPMDGEF